MTFDDLARAFGDWLFADFLEKADVTPEQLRDWFERGIPAEYARMFDEVSKGRVPVSLWPKLVHPPRLLQKGQDLSIVDKTMEIDHRLAISRGRASSNMDAAFKTAYRSKNYTLTSLAAACGVDAALMSKYRRKLRRIPQERAEKVAKLIPWPADAKHWPGGIVPKD